jgi:23S rRNA pseudouridine1911/1915/1917 synthase
MSFSVKKYYLKKRTKAFKFLIDQLGYTMKDAQRLIDRERVLVNGKVLMKKSAFIKGEIGIIEFVPQTQNIKPIFQTPSFALFDKPSGVLIHPRNRETEYSLTHEIKYLFGAKANITHRIDKETSGLVIAAKDSLTEKKIKLAFENREIKKGYLAFVKGKLDKELFIDQPILKNRDFSEVKLKVYIHEDGKASQTIIKPLEYFPAYDATLIEALPLTGRQHQIRLHLFHVKHPIIGDPIYGVDTKIAANYLDGKLSDEERINYTGASRLMLHANWIDFHYGNRYIIYSKYNFKNDLTLCQKIQP